MHLNLTALGDAPAIIPLSRWGKPRHRQLKGALPRMARTTPQGYPEIFVVSRRRYWRPGLNANPNWRVWPSGTSSGACPASPVLLASQDPELPPLLHNVIPGLRGKRTSGDLARVRLYKSQNQFNFDDSGQLWEPVFPTLSIPDSIAISSACW